MKDGDQSIEVMYTKNNTVHLLLVILTNMVSSKTRQIIKMFKCYFAQYA